MHFLTPDFLAQCELCRVHVPTPNPRYAHNSYRDMPAFVTGHARILNEQTDLYHIDKCAATTVATGSNSARREGICRKHRATRNPAMILLDPELRQQCELPQEPMQSVALPVMRATTHRYCTGPGRCIVGGQLGAVRFSRNARQRPATKDQQSHPYLVQWFGMLKLMEPFIY